MASQAIVGMVIRKVRMARAKRVCRRCWVRVRNLDSSSMEAVEVMVVVMVDSVERLRSMVYLFSFVFLCGG